jgi:hypothetical protein
VAQETTFGVEQSSGVGSFLDVQHRGATFSKPQEMLANERIEQRPFASATKEQGAKSCTLEVPMDLTPTGVALDPTGHGGSPPSTAEHAQGLILQTLFGGYWTEEGLTEDVGTASTASTITTNSGASAAFPRGSVAGFIVGGAFEARQIRLSTGTTLSPLTGLSDVPDDQSTVYNAHVYYPDFLGSSAGSLQFVLENGLDRDNIWWACGLQATGIQLELGLKQLMRITASLGGAQWHHDDDVGTPIGGSAIAAATYTDGAPIPVLHGECLFAARGQPTTRTPVCPTEMSLTLNLAYEEIPCIGGVNGIAGYIMTLPDPGMPFATLSMTIPAESANMKTWEAARDAGTLYAWQLQIGNTPGRSAFLGCPRVQITDVQPAEAGPWHGVQVMCDVLENDADVTTGLGSAPIVLATL